MTVEAEPVAGYVERIGRLSESDPELQRLAPDLTILDAVSTPGLPLERLVRTALEGYGDRPALGERDYAVTADPRSGRHGRELLPRFTTISHSELHRRIKALAGAWRHDEQHRVDPGDFVTILGFASIDYTVLDWACLYARAVCVPLQSTLAGQDLDEICADTATVTIAATVDDVLLAAQLAGRHAGIRSVIVFDLDERVDDERDQVAAAVAELAGNGSRARLVTLGELESRGDAAAWQSWPDAGDREETMSLLLHSSGSTGRPKGAIITERVARFQYLLSSRPPVPVVRLIFAPLNHFQSRGQVFSTLCRGGTAYFTARPDLSTVFEDFRLARPTEASMFPRLMEMIHRQFLTQVARRSASSGRDPDVVRAEVMAEMRNTFLGDRLSLVITGAAPTVPEVRAFMAECFPVTMREGYGCTEAGGGITLNDRVLRPLVTDYKLVDVPELGYRSTDRPYPRGELVVKTKAMITAYFKRPEATAELFDADGFLRTGDIMEERGPDHLVYVDRRNDVLKLSQGEYVATGNIGTVFENGSPFINQIYVYGNSARSYLLAVIVPVIELVRAELGTGPDADPAAGELRSLLRRELARVAGEAGLKSFEVPRDFIVEPEPFTHENGLLTSVHKRRRPSLAARYGPALEQLYVDLDRRQDGELRSLSETDAGSGVLDRVGQALRLSLGVEELDLAQPYSFADLGGDSLGAAGFSALLSDIFDVPVPVNAILSPAGNVQQWARLIETLQGQPSSVRPSFATIHGAGAQHLDAADLDISRFLESATLDNAATDAPPDDSRGVLLTGATGFLGRFLCLEWLERLAQTGGRLFCLVRASDPAGARRRLADTFSSDPALRERFRELAADHLEVVVGDIGEHRLGLDGRTYERLASDVDRIVHPAALVNHLLGYEFLFDANVAGTAELAGLAVSRRQKRIDFVSSVAAARFLEPTSGPAPADEDTPLRGRITLSDDYSSSYGASKWAGEQLLHSVHRRFGVPVNVYRGDMMLPHTRYRGQLNVPDVFVRLLLSLVLTGVAPESFYALDREGRRQPAHYDGLPVDFIASAIVGSSVEPHREARTFHVVNHHVEDGISLDTIVDWIESGGYSIERMGQYAEWRTVFEQRLNALPAQQRAQSSLGVLDMFGGPQSATAAMIGSTRFQQAVSRLPGAVPVPHLSRGFIEKCLADLRALELLPEANSFGMGRP